MLKNLPHRRSVIAAAHLLFAAVFLASVDATEARAQAFAPGGAFLSGYLQASQPNNVTETLYSTQLYFPATYGSNSIGFPTTSFSLPGGDTLTASLTGGYTEGASTNLAYGSASLSIDGPSPVTVQLSLQVETNVFWQSGPAHVFLSGFGVTGNAAATDSVAYIGRGLADLGTLSVADPSLGRLRYRMDNPSWIYFAPGAIDVPPVSLVQPFVTAWNYDPAVYPLNDPVAAGFVNLMINHSGDSGPSSIQVDPTMGSYATVSEPVPEPSTLTLWGSALLGLGLVHLRRRRAKA